MEAKAVLRSVRISPKKLRPVAKLAKGLPLARAIAQLQFTPKKGAKIIQKVIESARANAFEKQIDVDTLKVKNIMVDDGFRLPRLMTRQRGSANRIIKRTSHITVVLDDAK